MLAESIAREREDVTVREKAQTQVCYVATVTLIVGA